MSFATRAKVISGYRRLFRASKFLFQEDNFALKQSRVAIRSEFIRHQNATDEEVVSKHLVSIDEAEDMMRHGIVQGKRNDATGNIDVKIKAEHTQAMGQNPSMTPLHSDDKISNQKEVVVTKSTQADK